MRVPAFADHTDTRTGILPIKNDRVHCSENHKALQAMAAFAFDHRMFYANAWRGPSRGWPPHARQRRPLAPTQAQGSTLVFAQHRFNQS